MLDGRFHRFGAISLPTGAALSFALLGALSFALLGMSAGSADAQQSTSATYQDWVVQCIMQAGPPAQRFCDMAQVTQIQGKNIPFSRVAIELATKPPAIAPHDVV